MSEYMMLMKGTGGSPDEWKEYIDKLVASGKFRGGSAMANGVCVVKDGRDTSCEVTGFMRFEANSRQEVQDLLSGNPVYEAGGKIEISEVVKT